MSGEASWAQCMDPEHVALVGAKAQAAVAARQPFEIVYRMVHADGTPRWVLDRGRGIYDENGRAVAIEGFVLDLTRQREAEDALREADTRKDEFLATLAHELRNPLAPLRNALHLMRLGGAAGDRAGVREIMERQVNHLVRLVDDLLEMSRITRGLLELRHERVEVATVVRNAIETSEPLIREAQHRLEVSLPGEALWLEGDPVRLSQILANLLNNAAKYTPDRGTIVLAARREGGQALLSVKDDGAGIGEAALGRIFEMFNREARADARGKGGLGIGLTLSRRLAEMHGGSIEARSEGEGKGSEFVVRLPLAASPALRAAPPPAGTGLLAPVRVLVVDDNRDAAASLGMVLEVLGAEVRLAHDGHEALDAFGATEPAVVLLDIGMPGMDGYEVARRLRARFPDRRPALVALTGWGQEEDRRRARDAGFEHHLVKPAELEALQSLFADIERGRAQSGQALRS
jgi:signal transduction histidine kinase/CheY-like chemotaxis protein